MLIIRYYSRCIYLACTHDIIYSSTYFSEWACSSSYSLLVFIAWGVWSRGLHNTRRSRVLYNCSRPHLQCNKSRIYKAHGCLISIITYVRRQWRIIQLCLATPIATKSVCWKKHVTLAGTSLQSQIHAYQKVYKTSYKMILETCDYHFLYVYTTRIYCAANTVL